MIWASLATATRVSYARKIQEFVVFRKQQRLADAWPLPVDHLMRFIIALRDRDLSARLIAVYLAALSFQARALDWVDSTSDFRIRRMLEGLRRSCPRPIDARQLVIPGMLKALCADFDSLCTSRYEALLFKACCQVLFFGAFRPSEVLSISKFKPGDRALRWGDCVLGANHVSLFLRHSKTDQRGKGQWVHLKRSATVEICPVQAIVAYRRVAPQGAGPLFRHENASPLTIYQFRAVFHAALRGRSLAPDRFGLHSFRIGAASTAARLGFPAGAIKKIGRWRSGAFRYYVR
ncbi:integrase/recombinase xerD homolog [Tiliqua scincoides]|uniref:integrase/recombinase xerD homolog n=1 Tax=Tiliqua scincoides TaxID=71010 RepID=UPI0034624D6E